MRTASAGPLTAALDTCGIRKESRTRSITRYTAKARRWRCIPAKTSEPERQRRAQLSPPCPSLALRLGSRSVPMKPNGVIFLWFVVVSLPLCAQDWTKESRDRAKRTALHDSAQLVRGDSGKWNDDALLQHAPPIGQKPAKVSLDAWADQLLKTKIELTDKDANWLIFRTEQLDDNDSVRVERSERRGQQITVVANLAKWQGKYFKNFTYYQVIGLNLGKLEPGKYEVKWIIQPLAFTRFDGDGKPLESNWPKDERPTAAKPTPLRLTFGVNSSSR